MSETRGPRFSRDTLPALNKDWVAKRRLAEAIRQLNELLVSAEHPASSLVELSELIETANTQLAKHRRRYGKAAWLEDDANGGVHQVFHELSPFTGASNPFGPEVQLWIEDDVVWAKTHFGWLYEGPPGAVHGGVIAALFDHMLGVGHAMLARRHGVTAFLHVDYKKPTPIDQDLRVKTWIKQQEGRKTFICCELWAGDIMCAACEGLMIRPSNKRQTEFYGNGD